LLQALKYALCRQERNFLLLNLVVYIATTSLAKVSTAKRVLQFYRYLPLKFLKSLTIPSFHMK
jgi:hypothetical protein